jgi:predicted nucleic acid-binding protein
VDFKTKKKSNYLQLELSATGLLKEVRKVFKKIPSTRSRDKKVSLTDSLMYALAMFSLKSPSLLAFDKAYKNPGIINNLKNLYGIKRAPSRTFEFT